jgi:L-ribulokinase
VINGGGIPRRNALLNQVYANAIGKPILVPESDVTSLGSSIFAFLAAGTYKSIEEAQDALCPKHRVFEPEPAARAIYEELFPLYRDVYFGFGRKNASGAAFGELLPKLRLIAAKVRTNK